MLDKLMLKVLDEDKDELAWVHFCYIQPDLYQKFLDTKHIERFEMAEYITQWAKEDFNAHLSMATRKDVTVLKMLIQDKYSTVYPQIVRKSATDRQGWARVWISDHISKELRRK